MNILKDIENAYHILNQRQNCIYDKCYINLDYFVKNFKHFYTLVECRYTEPPMKGWYFKNTDILIIFTQTIPDDNILFINEKEFFQ